MTEPSGTPGILAPWAIPRRAALKAVVALAAAPLAAVGREAESAGAFQDRSDRFTERDQLFDANWRFHRGDIEGAEHPEFDDSQWRTLDVPHDWSIENLPADPESTGEGAVWGDTVVPYRVGPFDRYHSQGGRDTGWVVGGTGWYRKHFSAPAPQGQGIEILFEGVYMDADVWLNGNHLGNHPYGYTTFGYDLTPHLSGERENVLAIRVRNEGRNSRWYSGSGIIRHVWLTRVGEVRVARWGVAITTTEVSADTARVVAGVNVENRGAAGREVTVRVRVLGPQAAVVAEHDERRTVAAGESELIQQSLPVTTPRLWSPSSPSLYVAEVSVVAGGATLDRVTTPFGIRKVEVDAALGLRINNEPVKLKGGCMHHDNGLLGAAAIDRAEERRVELMRANGFNAIRCSHNPPSPAFLDACDRVGMLVIDEAFDQWEVGKNPQDYHVYFKDWWQRDIAAMVLRDRNHPSVILWSIGNEIPERVEPRGVETAGRLVAEVKRLDPTRPVTMAVPFFFEPGVKHTWADSDAAFQHLDVCGYNYQWPEYESDHARIPSRVIMGTESFPLHAFENWQMVEKHPYVLGDFVWTGMDYLGESGIGNVQLSSPSPFGAAQNGGAAFTPPASMPGDISLIFASYPWFNAYCGDIDLIGSKKPQGFYRDVLWGRSKLEMAVERPIPAGHKERVSSWGWPDELRSWTWPGHEGSTLMVRVYSAGDQVRLLLNGREIGTKAVSVETKRKAEFEVKYESGELKAIAFSDGKQIGELTFRTTGPPAAIRLRADRSTVRPDRRDLCFVTLEVVDRAGNPVPDAAIPVTFSVSGTGELAGCGSANPKDVASFRQPKTRTFHGQCLAVLRPTGQTGATTLTARAEGLGTETIAIRISGGRA